MCDGGCDDVVRVKNAAAAPPVQWHDEIAVFVMRAILRFRVLRLAHHPLNP